MCYVGFAKRIKAFCPSDSVRPTDGLHAFNVYSCYVNNHFIKEMDRNAILKS